MSTNLFDLSNKVALVTGASRGIGEEIAKLLAEQGAHVIVSSRKPKACDMVVAQINEAGGSAEALTCNIGNIEEISAAFGHIRRTHRRLDILINNGATNPYFGDILDTDLAAFSKIIDVNVCGYFYMSLEGARLMREHGGGSIVNTASTSALRPGPFQGAYSISKAAVINMTKSFAKEVAQHGIRVNALVPGLTRTKFAEALFNDETIYDTAMKTIPMQRHAEPNEMAGTVLYLVSDAASYTTGECIVVDGGLTL